MISTSTVTPAAGELSALKTLTENSCSVPGGLVAASGSM
jgi:hypothetical protein